MRLVFFGLINHQHIINFASSLKKNLDVEFYGINNNPELTNVHCDDLFEKVYNVKRGNGVFSGFFKFYSSIVCLLQVCKYNPEIIQFHYISLYTLPLTLIALIKGIKTSAFIYGSDFMRSNTFFHVYLWLVFFFCDSIVCDSTTLFNALKNKYPKFQKKMECIMFGSIIIDKLSEKQSGRAFYKKKLGLPEDRFIITCGYNASEAQNHMKIISEVKEYKDKCFFIFPMTYAKNEKYIDNVKATLEENGMEYLILDSFVPDDLWCDYTASTDIFIHMQRSDAFSSSLAEHLYMGNGVINAEWLKYEDLESNSIYYESCNFNNLSEVFGRMLINICDVQARSKCNKQPIYELKSLNYCTKKYWSKYFIGLLNE